MKGFNPPTVEPGEPVRAEDWNALVDSTVTDVRGDGHTVLASRFGNTIALHAPPGKIKRTFAKLTGHGQTVGAYTASEVLADGSSKTNGLTFDATQNGDNITGDLHDLQGKAGWYNDTTSLVVEVGVASDSQQNQYWYIDGVLGTTAGVQTRSRGSQTISTKVWDRTQPDRGDGGDGFTDVAVLEPQIGGSPLGVTVFDRTRTHDSIGMVEMDDGSTEQSTTVRADASDSPKDNHLTYVDDSTGSQRIATAKLNQPQATASTFTFNAGSNVSITPTVTNDNDLQFDDSGRYNEGDNTLTFSATDTRTNVSDDGSTVVTNVTDINFTGDATVTDDTDGGVTVDVDGGGINTCSAPSDNDALIWDANNSCWTPVSTVTRTILSNPRIDSSNNLVFDTEVVRVLDPGTTGTTSVTGKACS